MASTIDLQPLEMSDRRKSSIAVHTHLRDLILKGLITPGTVLSQLELSKALGVSRTPLREAFRMLQEEGLIEAEPNYRARVSAFDANDLDSAYATRILLESLGVALTVPTFSEDELASAEVASENMRAAITTDDFNAWHKAHRMFHTVLTSRSGDELARLIQSQAMRGDRYLRYYQSAHSAWWWRVGAEPEHRAILQACIQHRRGEAVSLIAGHLARTALAVLADVEPERTSTAVQVSLQLVTGLVVSEQSLDVLPLLLGNMSWGEGRNAYIQRTSLPK